MRPLLIAALLSSGCSLIFQPSGEDRPSTAGDVDAYFSSYYDAVLQARATCSGTTLAHARTLWLGPKASHLARAQALFATGSVRLKRDLGRACLDAVAAATPACTTLDATLLDPTGICGQAFAGILADGAECGSGTECRPGSFCDLGGGTCPGHCTAYREATEHCDDTTPCGYGLTCTCGYGVPPCGDTRTCHPALIPEGQPCGPGGAPCAPGLHCAIPESLCAPLLGLNEPCTGGACRPELRCDAGLCVDRPLLTYACTPGLHECEPSAWCDDADSRCKAFGAAGAACGVQPSGELRGCIDADCSAGTCVALPAFGASCVTGQRCAPLSTPALCNATGVCGELCGPG